MRHLKRHAVEMKAPGTGLELSEEEARMLRRALESYLSALGEAYLGRNP